MRRSKEWVYQCDHCGKKGRASGHMRTHERHCTVNPERVCRVCALIPGDATETPLSELKALVPADVLVEDEYFPGYFRVDTTAHDRELTEALIAATGHCPACMLAVYRQLRIHHGTAFDYKASMREVLNGVLESEREPDGYY